MSRSGRHALRPFRLNVRASVGAVHTRSVHAFSTGRLDAHRQGRDWTLLGRSEGPVIPRQSRERDRIGRVQFVAEGLRQVHRFGAKVGVDASADVSTPLRQGSDAFKGAREDRASTSRQDGLQNVVAILRQARGVCLGDQVYGARDSGLNRDLGSDGCAARDVGGRVKTRAAESSEQSGGAVKRLADDAAFSFPERIVTRGLSELLTTGALTADPIVSGLASVLRVLRHVGQDATRVVEARHEADRVEREAVVDLQRRFVIAALGRPRCSRRCHPDPLASLRR